MKHLMKKQVLIPIAVVLLVILFICSFPMRSIECSDRHTRAEIKAAMNAAIRHFKSNDEFPRTLLRIRYDDDFSLTAEGNADNTIVFLLDFHTWSNSGPFNPNYLYTDFHYKMALRNGEWVFVSGGY